MTVAQHVRKLTQAQRTAIEMAFWSESFGRWHLPLATNLIVVRSLSKQGLLLRPPGWKLNKMGELVHRAIQAENPHAR